MKKILLLLIFSLALFTGCQSKEEGTEQTPAQKPEPAPTQPVSLLAEPIEAQVVELPTDAIAVWRRYLSERPTLVLLSNDPFLQPIPKEMEGKASQLVREGTSEDFRRQVAPFSPEPVLLPTMALRAALQYGLLSQIIWVLPSNPDNDQAQISLEVFRKQLLAFGAANEEEAASFILQGDSFAGVIQGLPFRAVYPSALPKLDQPALVHIDLSYFKPFYKNEIKTPVYPLAYGTLNTLKEAGWDTLAVTVSLSNISGTIPVDSRFLGPDLAELFREPARLDEPLPRTWAMRREILYLENFFQTDRLVELAQALETEAPESASARFFMYQAYSNAKEGGKALENLRRAVELDRGYAMEYLDLAPMALNNRRPDEALRMMDLAVQAFPENPFIRLNLLGLQVELQQKHLADALVQDLLELNWSPTFYGKIPVELRQVQQQLADIHILPRSSAAPQQ